MRPIGERRYVTLHASDTYPHMDIGVKEIRGWHINGNGWSDIGYHWVIRRDGTLEVGRDVSLQGAHVGGFNAGNLGICLVGGKAMDTEGPEDNYTNAQWITLYETMKKLVARTPSLIIMGHNGWPGHEARGCPCFDWRRWKRDFYRRLHQNAYQMPSHWYDEVDKE